MTHFTTLGIVARTQKHGVRDTVEALLRYCNTRQLPFVFDAETATQLAIDTPHTQPGEQLGAHVDLIIVVGGDGSMLHASHDIIASHTPMLGINRGRLGFLTDIHPNHLDTQLDAILAGHYTEETRLLLEVSVLHEGVTLTHKHALNEVMLMPNATPSLVDFEVLIDDVFMCRERSDGLIVATPTGSTAYALSAGGPILHPELNAITLVPVFSHTLSSRPIVLDAKHTVRIDILGNDASPPRLACDGNVCIDIPAQSTIIIRKHKASLHLVHPLDYDYFGTLRDKLHWGKKHYHEN